MLNDSSVQLQLLDTSFSLFSLLFCLGMLSQPLFMKNSVISLNHFTTLPKQIRAVNAFLCKGRLHAFTSVPLFTITVSSVLHTFLRKEAGSRLRFLGTYRVSTQLERKRNLKYKFTAEEKPKQSV